MPNEKVTRVVKIDGKEVDLSTLPEFNAILEEVRGEEKSKLYSKIGTLEAQIKIFDDEKKANGTLTKAKEDELKLLREELGAVKAEKEKLAKEQEGGNGEGAKGKGKSEGKDGGKDADFDESKFAAMLAAALQKELAPLHQQNSELTQKLQEVQTNVKRKTVDEYRQEQLAKHKGIVIPELVPTGLDSEEAVNAAIQRALETSKNYLTREVEENGAKKTVSLAEYEALQEQARKAAEHPATPPAAPEKPGGKDAGDLGGKELLGKVGEMTDAEYEKYRDQILKETAQVSYESAG